MPRYYLTIEYDGTAFSGWQRQAAGVVTIQGALEDAGYKLTGEKAFCVGAGRTDTGVHALCMGAHIDLAQDFDETTVANALNAHLRPLPAAVLAAIAVSETFHARFSCLRRQYLYKLIERRAPLTLDAGRLWQRPYELDVDAMKKASSSLIGKHDFTTFRSVACQSYTPVKTLDEILIKRIEGEIHIHCTAPSFLHNQIRSLVGTLERVGAGRWASGRVEKALLAKDRAACGPVAPAHGLYFVKAEYPVGSFDRSGDKKCSDPA